MRVHRDWCCLVASATERQRADPHPDRRALQIGIACRPVASLSRVLPISAARHRRAIWPFRGIDLGEAERNVGEMAVLAACVLRLGVA
ncbi:hypothetical protein [Lysobacter gummosus]|uniref:hypothetical protein n=1 Tax=Lysobacter gummosus TaxID=262324 RepID=UPI00362C5D23